MGRKTAPGKSAAPRKVAKAGLGSGTRARPGGVKEGSRPARRLGGKPASKPAVKMTGHPTRKKPTTKNETTKREATKRETTKPEARNTETKETARVSGRRPARKGAPVSLLKGRQAGTAKQEKPAPTVATATARSDTAGASERIQTGSLATHVGEDASRARARGIAPPDAARSEARRGDVGAMKVQEPAVIRGAADAQHGIAPNGPPAGGAGQAEVSGPRPGLPVPIASFTI